MSEFAIYSTLSILNRGGITPRQAAEAASYAYGLNGQSEFIEFTATTREVSPKIADGVSKSTIVEVYDTSGGTESNNPRITVSIAENSQHFTILFLKDGREKYPSPEDIARRLGVSVSPLQRVLAAVKLPFRAQ